MTSALLTSGEYNKAPIKQLKKEYTLKPILEVQHSYTGHPGDAIHSDKINPNIHTQYRAEAGELTYTFFFSIYPFISGKK